MKTPDQRVGPELGYCVHVPNVCSLGVAGAFSPTEGRKETRAQDSCTVYSIQANGQGASQMIILSAIRV